MFTADDWPIAGNLLAFGATTPDGTPTWEASADYWADCLRQMRELGFDHIDPTDAWLPLQRLSPERLAEFKEVLAAEGLGISSISMTRNSVVDVENGERNLADAHRLIDIAPEFGATIVNTGFMQRSPRRSRRPPGSGSKRATTTTRRCGPWPWSASASSATTPGPTGSS